MMPAAREEVLARVREALRDIPAEERPDDVPVAREYRTRDGTSPEERVARFAERVADYRASVQRVSRAALPSAVGDALGARGAHRVVVPPDLPAEWRPADAELLVDGELANDVLDAADGVLTGCALGIAETGTIVLDGGARQGRRAIPAQAPAPRRTRPGPSRRSGRRRWCRATAARAPPPPRASSSAPMRACGPRGRTRPTRLRSTPAPPGGRTRPRARPPGRRAAAAPRCAGRWWSRSAPPPRPRPSPPGCGPGRGTRTRSRSAARAQASGSAAAPGGSRGGGSRPPRR